MKKEFMLSFANLRRAKGHTVSLFLLFLIASLLLNAGLLVLLNFGSYFQKMTKELNTSDSYLVLPTNLYNHDVQQFIQQNGSLRKMQKEDSLRVDATIPYGGDKRDCYFLFNDASNKRSLSKWKFIGPHLAPDGDMPAYVPYLLNSDGGYRLNDKLAITTSDGKKTKITFTIKGFTDDAFFDSFDTGLLGIYLPHQSMESLRQKLGNQYGATLIFANVSSQDNNIASGVKEILQNKHLIAPAEADNTIVSVGLPLVNMSRTLMASVISSMMVVFAAIIVIVCLAVIRFRISTSIEDDMMQIGSLKAIGYTSKQIIGSIVLQFSLIGFLGSVAGIALSYLTTPSLSEVFEHQSGFRWVQGFDAAISCITLGSILGILLLVAFLSARRIRKLNPIVALRGGIVTHSFKKNYCPLDRSKGSLSFLLGLKSMLQSKKNSAMIAVVLIFVSFASAFSVVLFYNSTVDTSKFAQVPGIEQSDAEMDFKSDADSEAIVKEIKSMDGVRKTQYIDRLTGSVRNTTVYFYAMNDYSQKETNTIYEGRYPRHDNEVAMSGIMLKTFNKKIGDTITLKIGSGQADFLITGLTQGISLGGATAFLTHGGMLKLDPGYKQQTLMVYLNDRTRSAPFVKTLDSRFGKSFLNITDVDKSFQQDMGSYTSILSKVGVVIFVSTILIVLLVLYFVVNSSITRQKRELGIQKALGFTTFQLMNQVSLSFLLPVTVGTLLGCILGITQTNAVMSVGESSMYIAKADYIITPGWIALCGLGIVIVSYLVSLLITCRIRKISAYSLISE